MYYAKSNQVWVKAKPMDEVFLIVMKTEPVNSGIITLEEQAKLIAELLNKSF